MSSPRHFNILIEETDETFKCGEQQHLLSGLAATGKRGIPSGCHGGGCGVCKIRIIKGDFTTLVMSRSHISADEQSSGIVLACRVFPRSDIELKVIGKLQQNILKSLPKKKYGFV